jgi:hypothetical protein
MAEIADGLEATAEADGRRYSTRDAVQFVRDMEDAGLEVEHYRGRYYWEGPAVRVDELQDALSATRVKCQWDNMGLGWVVYPKGSDAGVVVDRDLEPCVFEGGWCVAHDPSYHYRGEGGVS